MTHINWIWPRALELGYQQPLISDLGKPSSTVVSASRPAVHTAFRIDVRSEVFRRALEVGGPEIETLGFAGFFGAPIAHQSLHDGKHWAHEPLRLSVFIQASTAAIAGVIAAHPDVQQLVDNE